ncbi:hypothetical protein OESDEN_22317 [Oesophagostomum dentatum]|uniref:Polysaccharide biosynthesis domain-containing protein n=1 Tax=Oesophagostomum dentatum TaxID=61180 RepID=A0A0B1RYA2_OESDE|nr:hypothetical protein OESDEN_22317 [Oesophagostomum dentatum]
MRMEACKGYSEENTIVVPKIIYLAVEIARNIEGINEKLKMEFTEDHRKNGAQL